ncbi:hypothetical protein TRIUR3_08971 [Triticum urartu]|uniref:Uncharacterized protein n=1 Tax=Triticum urartu TaxID=4572 RepID=M7Z1K1_TRIUA|nr:hypothetical protein TRIUR3_08971 [Triticum urartu]
MDILSVPLAAKHNTVEIMSLQRFLKNMACVFVGFFRKRKMTVANVYVNSEADYLLFNKVRCQLLRRVNFNWLVLRIERNKYGDNMKGCDAPDPVVH